MALRRYSLLLSLMGPAEALRVLDEAARCEPLHLHAPLLRADVFLMLPRFDQAKEELHRVVERDPTSWLPYMTLAFIHWTRGAFDEVHASYRAAAKICGSAALVRKIDVAFGNEGVTRLYTVLARHAEAREVERPYRLFELTIAHIASGNHSRAFEVLEEAFQQGSPYLIWLLPSPYVDMLRGEARFSALLACHKARGARPRLASVEPLARGGSDLSARKRLPARRATDR